MNTRTPSRVDPALIHESTRTTLTTNATGSGAAAQTLLRVTRMSIRLIDGGDVEVRFAAHAVNVTPRRRVAGRGMR